jgi:ribosomal protein S18 acetylase RimI-like enzyme
MRPVPSTAASHDNGRMLIRPFDEADTEQVVALWQLCALTRPWNDAHRDIARKLGVQRELFLIGVDASGTVVATAMGGYEGHRAWVNYLAVHPDSRGAGHARALMEHLESLLLERGCPKLNLQVRAENTQAVGFYRAMGYFVDDVVSMGKRLIPDR